MYEVGVTTRFRAWHLMPGMAGPEGQLHSHDYRMEVVVARAALDTRGMVVDIDELNEALDKTIGRVADQNLDVIRPPAADAVTVEVFARWAHEELSGFIGGEVGGTLSVRVWESPVAFGGYTESLGNSSS